MHFIRKYEVKIVDNSEYVIFLTKLRKSINKALIK